MSKEIKKYFYYVMILSFLFWGYYLFSGKVILAKYLIKSDKDVRISKEVSIPSEYYNLSHKFEYEKIDSKILILPNASLAHHLSYQWNDLVSGGDFPELIFRKPTYGRCFWENKNFKNFCFDEDNFLYELFPLLNVKDIVIRKDVERKYGNYQGKLIDDPLYFRDRLSEENFRMSLDNSRISLFNGYNYFLPHFYTSSSSYFSAQAVEDLPQIVSSPDYQIRSAIYFRNQNLGKDDWLEKIDKIQIESGQQAENLPTTEFKKINPTKYRLRIHGANGVFPLVFSESFHDGWKTYLAGSKEDERKNAGLDKYRILDGNEDDQATKEELADYVEKGWVSDLGDGEEKEIEHKKWEDNKEKLDYIEKYNIDFVSKNFQGTIQNDNLPKGHFWETWFQKPIEDNKNHLTANGYANSWAIDADDLCLRNPGSCVKNSDGSYDFEMVVEFWPQRLFYVGLFISGTTLLGCLGYLVWDWRRRKEKAKDKKEKEEKN